LFKAHGGPAAPVNGSRAVPHRRGTGGARQPLRRRRFTAAQDTGASGRCGLGSTEM